MNVKNNFQVIGRLTSDPFIFENKDGSKKVRFTIASKENYKSKKGKRDTQFIPVECFLSAKSVSKNDIGVFAYAHKGDYVAVTGRIRNNNFTDKNGELHYELLLQVETYDFMEYKTTNRNRGLNKVSA